MTPQALAERIAAAGEAARAADPPPGPPPHEDMRWIPGGTFAMGGEGFYDEEGPVRPVAVDGFWMDSAPVTVRAFRRFVKETGYVTVAQQELDPALFPGADPALLVPGALVFRGTPGPVRLDDFRAWWAWQPGARWDRPDGPGSDIASRADHPVTQISYDDAVAYATWAGKALPTEAEWERAARGGLEGAIFAWGDEEVPAGERLANTWQGQFPWENTLEDGYERTSPVGTYPPNGFGLIDATGNVWEWTADFFTRRHPDEPEVRACCAPPPRNPAVLTPDDSYRAEDAMPGVPPTPRRVIKGGSHLCAPSYCLRYRPAARQGEAIDTATSHIGMRCIVRPGAAQSSR